MKIGSSLKSNHPSLACPKLRNEKVLMVEQFKRKMYTRVSLSELVPLSRPPLCNSLSERTPYRNVLLIGTVCNVLVIGTALCDSLSERTPYRNN